MKDTFKEALARMTTTIESAAVYEKADARTKTAFPRFAENIGWFTILTFRSADTSAELYVHFDNDGMCRTGHDMFVTDIETGDVYKRVRCRFSVGYPAHGSEKPHVVVERAQLILDVATLACSLQEQFNEEYLWLHKTKAEMDEIEAQKEASEARRRLDDFVSKNSVRQPIGKERVITGAHTLPRGAHHVTLDNGRNFKVEVVTEFTVRLTRLD